MTAFLKRRIFFLSCVILSFSTLSNCWADDVLDRIKKQKQIKIAHREVARPFSYLDRGNKPIGFAIDICGKVIERIKTELKLPQLKVKYVLVNAYTSIKAIKEENVDLECGTTANTETLRRQVTFSIPYFFSSTRMMVHTQSPIRDWSDLTTKRITFVNGGNSIQLLRKQTAVNLKKIQLRGEINSRVAFDHFATKQVDAFIADEVTLSALKAGNKNPQQFDIRGSALGTEAFAIMMRKNMPDLKAIVDKEIARLMDNGEFTQLYDKWFMQTIAPHQINYQLPMSFLLRENMRFPSDKVIRDL
jgi:ABC-type amino acid transport substrate-binding protein